MKTFKTWDDIQIAYQEWGGATASSPPVVLHHGFVADANANWVTPGVADPLAVRPEVLVAALPSATPKLVSGNHMAAVADPQFAQAIVEFVALGDQADG